MAETDTTSEQNPNDVGTFVNNIAIGYAEPDDNTIMVIQAAVQRFHVNYPIEQNLLRQLLTIKLLAPHESKGLRIYNAPEAAALIEKLSTTLVLKYYREASHE